MSDQNSDPSRPFDPPVPPTQPPTAPPAPPEAPPAPPAPPEPERPAVPQYGEYAPAGYVSPVQPVQPAGTPSAPVNPYGVPVYGAPAVAPVGSAPAYAPLPKKRRTWDVVLTIILLVVAFFGMIIGIAYAAIFSDPDVLSQAMSSAGYGTFTGSAGAAPTVLVVSHIVLFLLALGLSIPLLIRGRIVVFWIPLAIGVVAAIIFWASLVTVLLNDPGFITSGGN
jgi:uncharacterized membrane protein (DUF485 family)